MSISDVRTYWSWGLVSESSRDILRQLKKMLKTLWDSAPCCFSRKLIRTESILNFHHGGEAVKVSHNIRHLRDEFKVRHQAPNVPPPTLPGSSLLPLDSILPHWEDRLLPPLWTSASTRQEPQRPEFLWVLQWDATSILVVASPLVWPPPPQTRTGVEAKGQRSNLVPVECYKQPYTG